jgi:5-methylcytosine-specific restriction endonuclease McrA
MICRYCGKEFEPKKRGRKNTGFCCKHCADNYRHAIKRYGSLKNKPVKMKKPEHLEHCKLCGKPFKPSKVHRHYCSDACANEAKRERANAKRRQRRNMTGDQKKKFIKMTVVYRRDHGVCQICGLPIPAGIDTNDDWAPSVDHVIPVSKGGAHNYGNVQLAHRVCNSMKQDSDDYKIDWNKMLQQDYSKWQPRLMRLARLLEEQEAVPVSPAFVSDREPVAVAS